MPSWHYSRGQRGSVDLNKNKTHALSDNRRDPSVSATSENKKTEVYRKWQSGSVDLIKGKTEEITTGLQKSTQW